MSRVIYETATSFDGYIADENNSLDWLFTVPGGTEPDPELAPPQASIQVMGSTTYEWVLNQLNAIDAPDEWAKAFGKTPVFVFTSRRLPTPDGSTVGFLNGKISDALPQLREAAAGGDIWVVGGGDLAGQFMDSQALDRLVFTIAPVALGSGAQLLPRRVESDRLTLTSVKQIGQFARLSYEVSYKNH
ncbi:dihydrofolate reductase family protein [Nesterenkonia ebinurensis]|uniref:dihydrofolate reductase family protein n=1 Tax=Nesterenkonia ebinurensis TaxID=2608252 RepID=UPI00123D011A|nr:dihydrofolate reductase family protein [Nesterenkonia ebinurensis]